MGSAKRSREEMARMAMAAASAMVESQSGSEVAKDEGLTDQRPV